MTAIAYTFTLTDGREITSDPEEFDTDEARAAADAKTDREIEDAGLRMFARRIRTDDAVQVTVAGHGLCLPVRHVLLAAVEVYR